jgi:hypothetical protein
MGALYKDRLADWPSVVTQDSTRLLEAAFSVRFITRLYREGKLPLESLEATVRRVGVSCETAANTEVEEATALEAVTRQQPVKTEQTENISYII